MRTSSILILGAASDIGHALARAYAAKGYSLILAARRSERLEADVADLLVRGASAAQRVEFDVTDVARHRKFADDLGLLPDVVICVAGFLGDQKAAENDATLAETIMRTNYLGPALILGTFANRMEERGSGRIIGISSVAGDRGRASNYIYGSAKAGFTAFLSGLRNRLAGKGVRVMTVKPGFVATRMTEGMKLPKLLTAEAGEVAKAILKAAEKNADVIYIYPVWRWIMLIIRHIPESIFKRLKL
jgi:decaprenylphospho-beta-D-erythro-pentofuranosid-2-ulose 2-reductase